MTQQQTDKLVLSPEDVTFVLCVESNRLQTQALLLCESIREYGGRYSNAAIVAVSPRPQFAIDAEAGQRLEDLGVDVVREALNRTGHPYGTINRIVVGAWAERQLSTPYLVVLDTDTLFVGEPTFFAWDVGVRPVDMKGSTSTGSDDALDAYWQEICDLAGISIDDLPMLSTTIDKVRVRSSYNGGFAVIRRSLGVLQLTERIFLRSLERNLRPLAGQGINVFASTGHVGELASEWWGSSQAALSASIWAKTKDVHIYDSSYNIPLHLVAPESQLWPLPDDRSPRLLHYHFLIEPEFHDALRSAFVKIECPPSVVDWVFRTLSNRLDAPIGRNRTT